MATLALFQSPYDWRMPGYYAVTFGEKATQTFVKGEPVNLSSGTVQRIVATSTALGASDYILGVAKTPASGTTGTPITVSVTDDRYFIGLPCVTSVTTAAATAVTQIGVSYALAHTATAGVYGYDSGDTSDVHVRPVRLIQNPYMAIGDTGGHALCAVVPAARQTV